MWLGASLLYFELGCLNAVQLHGRQEVQMPFLLNSHF